jgi:hypothetical protein
VLVPTRQEHLLGMEDDLHAMRRICQVQGLTAMFHVCRSCFATSCCSLPYGQFLCLGQPLLLSWGRTPAHRTR